LLSGAATVRPESPELLAVWLAETALDQAALGQPLPLANAMGDTADLQRELIDRLQALNVGAQTARAWADLMVNGIRDEALPAQITAVEDRDLPVEEPLAADQTSIPAPLGGGVHHVLREVLADDSAALDAAYDVAAHYLHDTTGEKVSREDVAGVVTADWRVATLVEVIALGHLALQNALYPQHIPVVLARQPMSVLFASAGPLQGFLATHQEVIRAVFERTLPGIRWDMPIGDAATPAEDWDDTSTPAEDWDDTSTPASGGDDTPVLGDMLAELLNPEEVSGGQWLSGLAGLSPAAVAGAESDGPWLLPVIDILADLRPEHIQIAADAIKTASLLNALDEVAPANLLQAVLVAATRSAAVALIRDLFAAVHT
jgi:hypothetical protein